MSKGFILMEVTVAYVILAFALVALVPAFILAIRANKNTEQIQTATDLAQELLEEIRLRKWDQNTPYPARYITNASATLGVDAGETATDKTTFNDIDDFNGWQENGAKDPLGNALAHFTGYTRTVSVQYVTSTFVLSVAATDYKQVSACAKSAKIQNVCLTTVFTNR